MSTLEIKNTLSEIIHTVTAGRYSVNDIVGFNEVLYFIISESLRAVQFVSIIEDEFEIELDDDEIDIYFFSEMEKIIQIVMNHLNAR
jgi:acyl carrier protein